MDLQTLIPLTLALSLAALVVAVGLDAEKGDLLYLFRRPAELAKAVLAVNVVVPLAAVLLISIFPLTPVARAGVLLMAASPAPPLVPGKALKTGSEKAYVYGLYTALVLLAVVTVPLTVAVLGDIFGAHVLLPPQLVARNVAVTVLAPLAVGVAVGRLAPAFARRAAAVLRTVAMVLLLLAVAPVLVVSWPALVSLAGNGALLAMALTAVVAVAAGHLLGGPERAHRGALAVTAATRHPGIAMLIATTNNADQHVKAAILAMLLVGLLVSVAYQLWLKRRRSAPPRFPARSPARRAPP